MRRVADDDGVRLGERLQPRCLVGRGAHDLAPVEHDEPGVDGDPQELCRSRSRLRGDRAHDLQAAEHGAPRVVLVHPRVAEAHEQPVALAVLDEAAEALDDLHAGRAVLAQDLAQLLGVDPVGQRGRPDEVAEHERHLAAVVRSAQQLPRIRVAGIEAQHRAGERGGLGAVAGGGGQAGVGQQVLDAPRYPLVGHRRVELSGRRSCRRASCRAGIDEDGVAGHGLYSSTMIRRFAIGRTFGSSRYTVPAYTPGTSVPTLSTRNR